LPGPTGEMDQMISDVREVVGSKSVDAHAWAKIEALVPRVREGLARATRSDRALLEIRLTGIAAVHIGGLSWGRMACDSLTRLISLDRATASEPVDEALLDRADVANRFECARAQSVRRRPGSSRAVARRYSGSDASDEDPREPQRLGRRHPEHG
jgi:hypothetical protein